MAGADRYFAAQRAMEICRNNISSISFNADNGILFVWLRDGSHVAKVFTEKTDYGRELLDLFGAVFSLVELEIDTEHG